MAVVNHDQRQVSFKIVYCGTPLGGKTTNLIHIHERLTADVRGDLVSIATARNRTLFFDFLPVHATEIAGYQTKFQLYTVPGQRVFDDTRQIVLDGVDGIVFVTDCDPDRMEANREALAASREALEALGRSLDSLPLIFQHNKIDLPNATRPDEIDAALEITRPAILGCARTGHNVFVTLDVVTQEVLRDFHSRKNAERPAAGSEAPLPAEKTRVTKPAAVVRSDAPRPARQPVAV